MIYDEPVIKIAQRLFLEAVSMMLNYTTLGTESHSKLCLERQQITDIWESEESFVPASHETKETGFFFEGGSETDMKQCDHFKVIQSLL